MECKKRHAALQSCLRTNFLTTGPYKNLLDGTCRSRQGRVEHNIVDHGGDRLPAAHVKKDDTPRS